MHEEVAAGLAIANHARATRARRHHLEQQLLRLGQAREVLGAQWRQCFHGGDGGSKVVRMFMTGLLFSVAGEAHAGTLRVAPAADYDSTRVACEIENQTHHVVLASDRGSTETIRIAGVGATRDRRFLASRALHDRTVR